MFYKIFPKLYLKRKYLVNFNHIVHVDSFYGVNSLESNYFHACLCKWFTGHKVCTARNHKGSSTTRNVVAEDEDCVGGGL